LQDVEQLVAKPPAERVELVVADEEEFRRLPATIQMYRAALALSRGDAPATIRHARLAIGRTTRDDHLTRAGASALLGLTHWGDGDLEAAHQAYSATVAGLQRVGHISDVLGCSVTLGDIRVTQGRLSDAMRTYEQALRLASDQGGTPLRGTADMYAGMSLIAVERNDLDAATRHLLRCQELGERAGLPQNPYRRRVATAMILHAEGDLDGALRLLDEAQQVYSGDFSPNVRPVPALTARLLAGQGRTGEALAWARRQGLSADDDLSYVREFEHVTLARVLLAQYATERTEASAEDAARLLERLRTAAEAGQRTGSVIEILVLQSLVHRARGDIPGALVPLERALALAEPEGYVRVFLSEGPPMVALLRAAAKRRISWGHVRRLLDAADRGESPMKEPRRLVEPLSERELEVLRLLGTDLDGPAIARRLVVSLNTLRTHTRNIYAKLGVNSRRAAVRQAAELNLLSRTRER
jgi:LuxR family maltose regulon positive regulatory protein